LFLKYLFSTRLINYHETTGTLLTGNSLKSSRTRAGKSVGMFGTGSSIITRAGCTFICLYNV